MPRRASSVRVQQLPTASKLPCNVGLQAHICTAGEVCEEGQPLQVLPMGHFGKVPGCSMLQSCMLWVSHWTAMHQCAVTTSTCNHTNSSKVQ